VLGYTIKTFDESLMPQLDTFNLHHADLLPGKTMVSIFNVAAHAGFGTYLTWRPDWKVTKNTCLAPEASL